MRGGADQHRFTGKGAVASKFRTGKHEVNNLQSAAFLNAVAAEDPHRLYSANMTVNEHGGITGSGSPGEFLWNATTHAAGLPRM